MENYDDLITQAAEKLEASENPFDKTLRQTARESRWGGGRSDWEALKCLRSDDLLSGDLLARFNYLEEKWVDEPYAPIAAKEKAARKAATETRLAAKAAEDERVLGICRSVVAAVAGKKGSPYRDNLAPFRTPEGVRDQILAKCEYKHLENLEWGVDPETGFPVVTGNEVGYGGRETVFVTVSTNFGETSVSVKHTANLINTSIGDVQGGEYSKID